MFPDEIDLKASVTYHAAIELRLKPVEMPEPKSVPEASPSSFLFPLYDAHAAPLQKEIRNSSLVRSLGMSGIFQKKKKVFVVVEIHVHKQNLVCGEGEARFG